MGDPGADGSGAILMNHVAADAFVRGCAKRNEGHARPTMPILKVVASFWVARNSLGSCESGRPLRKRSRQMRPPLHLLNANRGPAAGHPTIT